MEDGAGIAHPEGAERIEAAHEVGGDGLEAERGVDAQARPQLIRLEDLVGIGVDTCAELGHPARLHRQPGGLLVAAEADEEVRALLECRRAC